MRIRHSATATECPWHPLPSPTPQPIGFNSRITGTGPRGLTWVSGHSLDHRTPPLCSERSAAPNRRPPASAPSHPFLLPPQSVPAAPLRFVPLCGSGGMPFRPRPPPPPGRNTQTATAPDGLLIPDCFSCSPCRGPSYPPPPRGEKGAWSIRAVIRWERGNATGAVARGPLAHS